MTRWPEDADAVVRRIRDELDSSGLGLDGLDAVRISAALRGDDLEHLTIDASGTALHLRAQTAPTVSAPEVPADIRSRRPGFARRVRVLAAPVLIDGLPLTVDAEMLDVPIEWVEYAEPLVPARPETAFGVEYREGVAGMRGVFSAAMRAADLGPLVERLVRAALATEGVVVRAVRVDLHQDGTDGIRLSAGAHVRWKLLSASARARARLRISPDAVVTVRDLGVGSRNPLVALALLAARKAVREQVGKTYDLNEELTGIRLHDVRLRIGDDVRIEARLG